MSERTMWAAPGATTPAAPVTFDRTGTPVRLGQTLMVGANSHARACLRRCADQDGILPHIRYGANAVSSRFDAGTSTWVVSTRRDPEGAKGRLGAFKLRDYLVKAK